MNFEDAPPFFYVGGVVSSNDVPTKRNGENIMPSIFNGFAVAVLMVACLVGTRINAAVITITEGSTSGYTMTDGNTYIIQDSVSFSNSIAGGSGMSVEENATVVLYVPDGVELTAIGANGSGQIGGGAGIHVPETATLVITAKEP